MWHIVATSLLSCMIRRGTDIIKIRDESISTPRLVETLLTLFSRRTWAFDFPRRQKDTQRQDFFVGLAEVQVWVPANTGPFYYAVDALPRMDTNVTFDNSSSATSTGGVLAPCSNSSKIDFSGIYSVYGGKSSMSLHFKNNGSSSVDMGVQVNGQAGWNFTLGTRDGYQMAEVGVVELWKGTNFVRVFGGGVGAYDEGITVG